MVAVRWPEPFIDPAWGFEIKWDGVRTILSWDGEVRLRSRAGNDATPKYPELSGFSADRPVMLDGEIVAFDDSGRPSFERLQQRMNVRAMDRPDRGDLVEVNYVVFDVLYDGVPLLDRPWVDRRERLAQMGLPSPMVPSEPVDADPTTLWEFVCDRGIEGIVGKRLDSPYRPGVRSSDWRKITVTRSVRAVVGGFTAGEGGRSGSFGSLMLGMWEGTSLRWVGAVGTGFSDADLRAVRSALDQMAVDAPSFADITDMPRGVTWVSPTLVAMVQFKEWTSVGRLRAPSFKGFTDDPVASITWDREGPQSPG
jgi:bifunctional non-homologous end joining protein LigD